MCQHNGVPSKTPLPHPRTLTEGDGSPTLRAAVILAVQASLWADAELVLGPVADLGAHAGLGDQAQALAVAAVGAPWRKRRREA